MGQRSDMVVRIEGGTNVKGVISSAVVLGIVGLAAGYFLFAKVGNSYIGVESLISPADTILERLGDAVRGIDEIRRKILISGGAGAAVGVVIGLMRK